MALYKAHKVNPLGGCLPMLIQIPVFFALFVVLRSAIELRFASFLWIADLSEPEGLFQGMIPIVGSLNLLPLLMAGTMWLQMKLSPSAGDPAQQKIMAVMMPIMMLVFIYNYRVRPGPLLDDPERADDRPAGHDEAEKCGRAGEGLGRIFDFRLPIFEWRDSLNRKSKLANRKFFLSRPNSSRRPCRFPAPPHGAGRVGRA
jgi:hypothetical protein